MPLDSLFRQIVLMLLQRPLLTGSTKDIGPKPIGSSSSIADSRCKTLH